MKFENGNKGHWKGKKFSQKHKDNLSLAKKNGVVWNRGLTKEKDSRLMEISKRKIGVKLSEEHKKKISESWNYDKHFNKDIKSKISKALKGIPKSENHKKHISEGKRGKSTWSKGLTKEIDKRIMEWSKKRIGHSVSEETRKKISKSKEGHEVSEETRKKLSKILNGRPKYSLRGVPKSEQHKKRMSLFRKGTTYEEIYGIEKGRERIRKMKITWSNPEKKKFAKERRAKQIFPIKDTKIEIKIQNFLSQLHIEFYTHKYISEITNSYQCDILIQKQEAEGVIIPQKTIIECDGCYWHGCSICKKQNNRNALNQIEKDKLRTNELQEKGFKVIRLWEHEIKTMEINDLKEKLYGL